MGSFATYVFIGIVWLNGGEVEPPIARTAPNLKACIKLAQNFEGTLRITNANESPGMRMSWHAECRPMVNDSTAKKVAFYGEKQ
jgi:hypothetical protein